jgi:hypothetical protein
MSNYDNNLRGIISKNDKKTEDKHPDIKGQCEIDGAEYWISGRLRERKDGSGKFYSLMFQPKVQESAGNAPTSPQKSAMDGLDDDLPF